MTLQEQTATSDFFVPVLLAWTSVLGGLEIARRLRPAVWPAALPPRSERRWLDLGIALGVGFAIVGTGQLWHAGVLRWRWPGAWDHAAYVLAQLLVWAPMPLAMWLRRQTAASAWTGTRHLPTRIAAGLVLGAVAVTVHLALRGDLPRWPTIVAKATTLRSLAHAAPVYLEGVGLAFLFVRLQWAFGRWLAALVPALLFAAAHVPRGLADGEAPATIAAFFVFNTAFVTALLLVLNRHRDVVALGVAHWLMDLATDAF
ncbi:MAG TPA: CPBP family glutamic-type intramembrane protease [Planctomycetota bacterium]|nr:CPBP family glutamic-type intramembrane protease [Planctomycetota bacterium]